MAVQFTCPACGRNLRMGDEFAGREVRCPGCREVVVVPHQRAVPQAAAARTRTHQTQQRPPGPVPGADVAHARSTMPASKQPAGGPARARPMAWVCIAGGGVLLALLALLVVLIFWRVQRNGRTATAGEAPASSAEPAEPKTVPPAIPYPPADTPTPVASLQAKRKPPMKPRTTHKSQKTPALRFDGLYQSEKVDDYWYYLRFHEDGVVLTASSTGTAKDVIRWLKNEKENAKSRDIPQGQYETNGDRLVFSSTSSAGTVDYEGTIGKGVLKLNSYSHINRFRATRDYRFAQFPEN